MATLKEINNAVSRLNNAFKFSGRKYKKLKTGTGKYVGKGFEMGGAYGRLQLSYHSDTTYQPISDFLTKGEMIEFIKGMIKTKDLARRKILK